MMERYPIKTDSTRKKLKRIFMFPSVVCRAFAAWLTFAAIVLIVKGEGFWTLSYAQDVPLWMLAVGAVILFSLFSVAAFFVSCYPFDTWLLLVSATVCVTFWIYHYGAENFLFLLAVALGYGMLVCYVVDENISLYDRRSIHPKVAFGIAIGLGVLCATVISVIGCLRYVTYSTPNYDFGLFCNMFYNMSESGLPMVTCERDALLSHFAVHISPVYYLLLPLYMIAPSPITLQIAQAVVVASGVIPTVLLARHFKLSGGLTVVVAALYALYPAITKGCGFDLHENCFLVVFLLFLFYFYETRKTIPMYVFAVLVLSVKEDAAIYLLFFAIYLLLSERKWIHGTVIAAMAVGYFLLCGYLLETYGEGMMVERFDNLIYHKDDGLLGAIKTLLTNPAMFFGEIFDTNDGSWDKIVYVIKMLLPLGIIPLCVKRPSRWLLCAPLLINLLTNYLYQYDIGFQYHFGITAFLMYALLKNLSEMNVFAYRKLLAIAVAVSYCFYLSVSFPVIGMYSTHWKNTHAQCEQMTEFLEREIPDDASVSASTFLIAHLYEREEIYEVHYHDNKPDVDYVVLDMRYLENEEYWLAYEAMGYTVKSQLGDVIVVLQRGESLPPAE